MPTLRQLREENYLSRKMLADASGVSPSTIIRMEEGKHVNYEIAKKVLEGLSKTIGRTVTLDNVEGIMLYNIMRDRKQRTKFVGISSEDAKEAA